MEVNTHYNKLSIKRDIIPEITPVASLQDITHIEQELGKLLGNKAIVVIWLMNRIVWTTYAEGRIELDDEAAVLDYWQEMRAFNAKGELHLVRCGEGFSGRSILDKEAPADWAHGYVDSISPIWGENTGHENGKVQLEDKERKLRLNIPVGDGNASKYGLVTRSYIKADDVTGLSGYVDSRLLAVEAMEV